MIIKKILTLIIISNLISIYLLSCQMKPKISVQKKLNNPDTNISQQIPDKISKFKYTKITATSIQLEWEDLNNEEGYVIQRSDFVNQNCKNYKNIYEPSQNITKWTDTNLIPEYKYCYKIYGYNNAGIGPISDELIIQTLDIFNTLNSSSITLIDTTTINPLNQTTQDKSFYDTVYKKYWIFYYDGSEIHYKYNSGNNTWTDISSQLIYNNSDFSLFYKVINNTPYVVLSIKKDNNIVLKKGTINNTSINFDNEIPVFTANNYENYAHTSIIIDKQNYIWIASGFYNLDGYYIKVKKSTSTITNNSIDWEEYTLNKYAVSSISNVKILPQNGSKIYLISTQDNSTIGYVYNGISWNEITNTPYKDWIDFGGGGLNMYPNAITKVNTDIYIGGEFWEAGGVKFGYIIKWDGFRWHSFKDTPNDIVKDIYYNPYDKNIYVGGAFTFPHSRIMKWNGKEWLALANGVNNTVNAITAINTDLYIAGNFTSSESYDANYIAKWNGTNWQKLHADEPNAAINAIASYESTLYIGGSFTSIGNTAINRIAKWDGTSWQALGTGANNTINTIAIINSNNIYIGGTFTNKIQKWNGTSWITIGALNNNVNKICIQDNNLYIGGRFSSASNIGTTARYIVKFNGTSFEEMDNGVGYWVQALACEYDKIYLGGRFIVAGLNNQIRADHIAAWNITNNKYEAIGASGLADIIKAVTVSNDNKIYIGGYIYLIGKNGASHFGIFDQSTNQWQIPTDTTDKVNSYIYALSYLNDNAIYAGGTFTLASNTAVNYIAKWNGTGWEPLQSGANPGLNGAVNTILAKSDTEIYVGGSFTANKAGTVILNNVAKFNGTEWEALGSGTNVGTNNTVYALAYTTLGDESYLYVGGAFTSVANTLNIPYIAKYKFNGSSWESLGNNFLNNAVKAIAINGSDVYIGGNFTSIGVNQINYIAKWNGSSFEALGEGVDDNVNAIAIQDNKIYIAGSFLHSANQKLNKIAMWDGNKWNPIGSGMNGRINSIAFDTSNNLIAAGQSDLKIYKNVLANTNNDINAITDKNDYLYLTHIGIDNKLYLSIYTPNGWIQTQKLSDNNSINPYISIDSDSNYIFTLWSENNTIKFRKYNIKSNNLNPIFNIDSSFKNLMPLGMLNVNLELYNIIWISISNDETIPFSDYKLYQKFIY